MIRPGTTDDTFAQGEDTSTSTPPGALVGNFHIQRVLSSMNLEPTFAGPLPQNGHWLDASYAPPPGATVQNPLIPKVIAGDEAACKLLLKLCWTPMEKAIQAAFAGKRPQEDVEDVLQQSTIALIEALPKFRGESSLATFARKIAYHQAQRFMTCNDYRRCVPVEPGAPEGPIALAIASDVPADTQVSDHELLGRLLDHLKQRMRPEQKQCFVLHFMGGLEHKRVAEHMGVDRAKVDQLIFQIRQLAKKIVAELTKEPP